MSVHEFHRRQAARCARLRTWLVIGLCAVGGLVAAGAVPRAWGQDGAEATEAAEDGPPPAKAEEVRSEAMNPMQAMANPTNPGAIGARQFSSAKFESGKLAWLLSSSLVAILLIPGLMLFYHAWCGFARGGELAAAGVLGVAVLCLTWAFWIYSLGFARNYGVSALPVDQAIERAGLPVIGGPDHVGLRDVGSQVRLTDHEYRQRRFNDPVPHLGFLWFQMIVFVAAAMPLLVSLWPHMPLGRLLVLLVAWGTFVYAPVANWVWGFGWLRQAVALDFGGASVVHVTAGFTALAVALVWQRRVAAVPAGPPNGLLAASAALVWIGSLAVQAGCTPTASAQGMSAVLTAHLAACAGAVGWAGLDWLRDGKPSPGRACGGIVAGLAAVAAGSGYIAPQAGIVVGLLGGALAAAAFRMVPAAWQDRSPLQVFVLQGVAGVTGLLLTAVFVSPSVAFGPDDVPVMGVLAGNLRVLGIQALACAATAGWSFLVGSVLAAALLVVPGTSVVAAEPA